MRLFTAIDLPDELVSILARLVEVLRPTAKIKWSPKENFHITTKFIGEWPDERLEEVERALAAPSLPEPIPIELRGVGFLPNPHSPRVFLAAVHAPASLAELARETDQALERLGITAEKRPFSPHLTLARIKEPTSLQALRQAVAALPSTEFGAFAADRFHLYRSQLNPGGSVYTKLSDFRFAK
jgi:RNA 2',3'-cyclic 3'-phosphodiesterase